MPLQQSKSKGKGRLLRRPFLSLLLHPLPLWILLIIGPAIFRDLLVTLVTQGRTPMRKARFTESQIITVIKNVEADQTVKDVCREAEISETAHYNWKTKYGGMEA